MVGNAPGGTAPREQLLFDFGWKFTFGNGNDPARDLDFGFDQSDFAKTGDFKFAQTGFDDSKWRTLNLPHDWAVELPFVDDDAQLGHGCKPIGRRYPETSVGWYRREFDIPSTDKGRRITLEFDGVFRDVLIFVNGCFIGRNNNGYASFDFDLTDFLYPGKKNCVVARVDASFGDGWFYEGAGIYRHVWLNKSDALHLEKWESTVRSMLNSNVAVLSLGSMVRNEGNQAEAAKVVWQIFDPDGNPVASAGSTAQSIAIDGNAQFIATAKLPSPKLWSPEEPHLYSALISVRNGDVTRDAERVTFGVRTASFDPDKGFLLNGAPLKIQGMCNHQDHAGVGAALPDRLQAFRVGVLRGMGCNAVRTSHNMPAPEWVQACDSMGVMVMCETRQMSANAEGLAQFETMIKRYRNSPSVILWSIGNEEFTLQDSELGGTIAAKMVRRAHELDPTRPVTAAVNGSNETALSEQLDVIGFNYHLDLLEPYHKKYPKRALFGSETASAVATRGEYRNNPLDHIVSAYDTHEGRWPGYESAEDWWSIYGSQDWASGGFAWTGFDYRGEPSPIAWPGISSQFGSVDTCGFPKDSYFYYKSWWGKEPVLHLLPHWNFEGREGDEIPVWVYSNLDEVELFVNGKSMGAQKVPRLGHVEWKVRYEPGAIEARGSQGGRVVLTERRETTGPGAVIRLCADRTEINADGEDVSVLKIEMLDGQGRLVPTDATVITLKVAGDGALIGVGNGDPNCHESDKDPSRSLFNGLAQAIIQSTKNAGEIHVQASKDDWFGAEITPAKLVIQTKDVKARPAVD